MTTKTNKMATKKVSLEEAKKFYETYKIFQIDNGRSYIINMFGKYKPNMSFIIPVEHHLDRDGNYISFLKYKEADQKIIDALGVDFNGNGSPEVLFGDFWRSKKGGSCFRPKSPKQAQHVLVRVNWGGAFSKCRGQYKKEDGGGLSYLAQYFRRAKSNGGGVGYDYYVFPMDAIGRIPQAEIREKYSASQAEYLRQEAELCQARIEAERQAEATADELWSRLKKVIAQAERAEICPIVISRLRRDGVYVVGDGRRKVLTEEYISEVEGRLAEIERRKNEKEERIALFEKETQPRLESLGFQAEVKEYFGGTIEIEVTRIDSGYPAFGQRFSLDPDDIAKLMAMAERDVWERERRAARLPVDDESWKLEQASRLSD